MKALINFFKIILLFSFSFSSQAQLVNIKDRIQTQEFMKARYNSLFGRAELKNINAFKRSLEKKSGFFKNSKWEQSLRLIKDLESIIPEKVLIPLVYWKVIENDEQKIEDVISYYMLNKLLILRDQIDHPLRNNKQQALQQLKLLTAQPQINSFNIYEKTMANKFITNKAKSLSKIKDINNFAQSLLNDEFISEKISSTDDYSLSYLGFIPGNQVQLISDNDQSEERVKWVNDRIMFNGASLDWSKAYMKMPTKSDIINYEKIPVNNRPHIVFAKDPIFMKIRDMIDQAEHSIFIDIFLFGGTMGGTLAKYLIDETIKKQRKNPKFHTILLHDFATDYNMRPEMLPVFYYIRDRIAGKTFVAGEQKVPPGVVNLLQANIQRHTPGIPFGLSNLIEKNETTFPMIEKRSTYYESKIDHSKVIVIDGNTHRAQAYFGSKNWTDHSGSYYYDNAIWVKGPVANLVQYSYYDDIEAALTLDTEERKWFYFKDKGLSNEHYLDRRDEILNNFKVTLDKVRTAGSETVRIAEANVDGRIKDTRNMLIDMILKAKSHIYMEQLFIYDKYINDALIKKLIQNPLLDVRILADHNGNFGMNGLPNTLFMKELKKYGVQLRARRTQTIPVTYPDGTQGKYHQENHRKIISVDGKVLLAGSSNMNPDTFQGSFREFGAQIFSNSEITTFEKQFLRDWADEEKTMDLEIEGLQLVIGGKTLSPEASALLNNIGAQLLRIKDDLEERY